MSDPRLDKALEDLSSSLDYCALQMATLSVPAFLEWLASEVRNVCMDRDRYRAALAEIARKTASQAVLADIGPVLEHHGIIAAELGVV